MKEIICNNCGGSDFRTEQGYMICNYCGSKFKPDATERPEKGTTINLASDIDTLLTKCETDPMNAKKYANLVLDIDPTNKEALKYINIKTKKNKLFGR